MADKIKFKGHVEDGKGNNVKTLNDGLREEAKCGCGIDCCENKMVLKDQSNGNTYEFVFDAGVMKFRLHGTSDSYTSV